MVKYVADLWNDVNLAVMEKDTSPEKYKQVYIGKIEPPHNNPIHIRKKRMPIKKTTNNEINQFWLRLPFKKVSFSRREVQVLFLMCQGQTNQQVSSAIGLSVRTVEYYLRNIRKKTASPSKADLIQVILDTNFYDRVDETILSA